MVILKMGARTSTLPSCYITKNRKIDIDHRSDQPWMEVHFVSLRIRLPSAKKNSQ